jgi:hypothetical protein
MTICYTDIALPIKKIYKIMSTTVRRSKYTISTLPPGNFCSVDSLLAATLYEENPDKKHLKLLNIA